MAITTPFIPEKIHLRLKVCNMDLTNLKTFERVEDVIAKAKAVGIHKSTHYC